MVEPGGLYYTEEGELNREALNLALQMQAGGLAIFQLLESLLMRQVLVTAPTVGTDWSVTVPPGASWEIIAAHARLVASAAVANRQPQLFVKDADGNFVYGSPVNNNIVATNAARVIWAGVGATVQIATIWGALLPAPPLIVAAGSSVSTVTTNIDVADQWSGIILSVREWSPGRVARYLRYIFADLDASGGIL